MECIGLKDISTINIKDSQELDGMLKAHKEGAKIIEVFFYKKESVLVAVADELIQRQIDFCIYMPEHTFLESKLFEDVIAYFVLAIDPKNIDAFKRICYKDSVYLKKEIINDIICYCKSNEATIYEGLEWIAHRLNMKQLENTRRFTSIIQSICDTKNIYDAMKIVLQQAYAEHLNKQQYDRSIIDVLEIIARKEMTVEGLIYRFEEIKREITKRVIDEDIEGILLSNIEYRSGILSEHATVLEI